jgi:SAM-dependent methyltransferase
VTHPLATGPGRALLDALPPYAADAALALATRLRAQGHDPELVTAALAQSRLRSLAVAKFGAAAASMLFTADGLEQATRPELAARHAARFAEAGVRLVHDLGCGIGSDARALAAAGVAVRAVDVDPATAAVAAANLAPWPTAQVRVGRAEAVALTAEAGVRHTGAWLDPARRAQVRDTHGRARRVFSLEAIEPSWSQVCDIAAHVPATGAKLSPAFPHAALPAGAEAQWTSWRGQLLECVVWWGPLVQAPGRSAAVCRPSTACVVTEADLPEDPAAPLTALGQLGPWLWEADRAVVQAGLTAALPGRELARGVGLSTADAPTDGPGLGWARRWQVVEAIPLRPKLVRGWLRAHDIGRLTIKKRGCTVDPARLAAQLRTTGSGSITLLATAIGGQSVALLLADQS